MNKSGDDINISYEIKDRIDGSVKQANSDYNTNAKTILNDNYNQRQSVNPNIPIVQKNSSSGRKPASNDLNKSTGSSNNIGSTNSNNNR